LENWRSKNDKMSRGVHKAVEIKASKIRVVKTKEERNKRGKRREEREEGTKRKDSKDKEGGRRIGNLGQ